MTNHYPHFTYATEVLDALANAQLWPDSHSITTLDSSGTHLEIHLVWLHGDAVNEFDGAGFELAWHSASGWRARAYRESTPIPLHVPTVASPQAITDRVRALVNGGPGAQLPASADTWHDADRLEAIEDRNWIPTTR
ncbi:hypothetical protein [Streptomyces harbinensis]|uniref:hypothetical protein n=1 Tax=Streptomyces harbinensis TaxID=1176198 RepID=UPI00368FC3C2